MAAIQDGDLGNVACCNALPHSLSKGQAHVVERAAKEGQVGQEGTMCGAYKSVSIQTCARLRISHGRSHNVGLHSCTTMLFISRVFAVLQGTASGQLLCGGWQGAKGLALSHVRFRI